MGFSDFAILFRTAAQLKPITEALDRSGMPYVKLSDDLLCDNKTVREFLKNLNREETIIEQLEKYGKFEDYMQKFLVKIASENPNPDDFIHQAALLRESDALDERADRITLMTLHSSKGLEFKCVFIAGLENGIMPLYRAETEEETEEERRLLYVGMTRAKQRLFLSRAIKRLWMGQYKNFEISPFLAKIENDLLSLTKFEAKPKDNSQQLSLF